jgi:hypothetical protein
VTTEQEHFDASRQFQAYYDETLRKVGTRAPAPNLGQSVNGYRRETLRQLKRTFLPPAHDLYQVQYGSLRSDALQALEPQLLQAVVQEANNPAHVLLVSYAKLNGSTSTARSSTSTGSDKKALSSR